MEYLLNDGVVGDTSNGTGDDLTDARELNKRLHRRLQALESAIARERIYGIGYEDGRRREREAAAKRAKTEESAVARKLGLSRKVNRELTVELDAAKAEVLRLRQIIAGLGWLP